MSTKRMSFAAVLILMVASLLLASCKAAAPPKVLTIAWTQEPATLNPFYTNMWFETVLLQLYNHWAWEFDDNNEAFPKMVTELPSMENGGISADGLTITLHLRDDIKWSDNTPITSADFKFTYDMIMDPANSVASQYPYDMLDGIDTPDNQTVVMRFSEPYAPWESLFWRGLMPKHVLEPVFTAEGTIDNAPWNLAPTVASGPYVFSAWESGSFIRFVKNPNYWGEAPKIDEIVFQFVPDDAAQTAALIAGDADLGTFPPISDVPDLQDAGLTIMVQPSGYQEGWFFNWRDMANAGAKDLAVRQAIAMAVDREAIARDLLLGLASVVETYWDSLPMYVPSDLVPWTYNPDAARQLLTDAGWIDTDGDGIREDAEGNPLVLVHGTTTREIRQDVQAVAQQYLKEVGIDLQLMNQDADLFFGSYSDGAAPALGEVDIMEWSDGPYFPDPDTDYWLCSQMPSDENPWGYNYYGCDEELDALFTEQLTILDADARAAIIHQIAHIIHDKVYWLGMYEDPDYWIVGTRLSGVKFSGPTPLYNIVEWDLTG
jgi:peptide/nickel transport system substrate-binding protein